MKLKKFSIRESKVEARNTESNGKTTASQKLPGSPSAIYDALTSFSNMSVEESKKSYAKGAHKDFRLWDCSKKCNSGELAAFTSLSIRKSKNYLNNYSYLTLKLEKIVANEVYIRRKIQSPKATQSS